MHPGVEKISLTTTMLSRSTYEVNRNIRLWRIEYHLLSPVHLHDLFSWDTSRAEPRVVAYAKASAYAVSVN